MTTLPEPPSVSLNFTPYIMVSVWPIDHPVSFSLCHSLFHAPCFLSCFPHSPPFLTSASSPHTLSRSASHYFYPPECGPAPLHANTKPQVLFCLDSTQAWELFQSVHQHLHFWDKLTYHEKNRKRRWEIITFFQVQSHKIEDINHLNPSFITYPINWGRGKRTYEVEWVNKKKTKAFTYCSIFLHVSSLRMLAHFHHIMSFPASLAKKPGPKHSSDQCCALYQLSLRFTVTRSDHEGLAMSSFSVSIKATPGHTPLTITRLIWLC